jgi:hypothetical protein
MTKEVHASWSNNRSIITLKLPYILFEEDGSQILYCPPLDLTGYGQTEEDAKHSFEIVLEEYFRYTINKGTLISDLEKLGWKFKKRSLRKTIIPPDLTYSLSANEDFRRIFNTHDFRKGNTEVAMPAVC